MYNTLLFCGNSSVGRAQPCQGWGREFESRFPLQIKALIDLRQSDEIPKHHLNRFLRE